jgi:hypothetical protein
MAKITRNNFNKKVTQDDKQINLETGDVTTTPAVIWSLSVQNNFVKCVSLVEQIKDQQMNLVDETTITSISYSLVGFGDRGKNLFEQVCLYQNEFSTDQLSEIWEQAKIKGTMKTPHRFIRLCKEKGLEVKINEDEGWEYKLRIPGQSPKPYTDELTETEVEEIREFGFIEKDNCYFFAEYNNEAKTCTLVRKSNFTLRVLFHINRGKQNKRVIEIVNNRHKKITSDIETKQLTSLQSCRELTEGQGNFLFDGTNIELAKIKNKLYNQEKPSQQIDMLGWNKQGKFFSFSNGLYNSQFHPVDEHGIVTLHDKN